MLTLRDLVTKELQQDLRAEGFFGVRLALGLMSGRGYSCTNVPGRELTRC